MKCAYCGNEAEYVTGEDIYPHRKDLYDKKFWRCEPCDAYVGCHATTGKPLGRLANAELRRRKSMAHQKFDPLWRNGGMSRSKAYNWLSNQLRISPDKCHIGMFDIDMCDRVIEVCDLYLKK